jgi:energy-coupling factor transport system permease protein
MTGILDYVEGKSLFHRLNPLTKLVLPFGLCAACFISGSIPFVLGIIALNLLIAAACGIAGRSLGILRSLVKFSLLLFTVQALFIREGDLLFTIPPGIGITRQGVLFSLLFILRLMAAALPLALTLSVTRISDISNALTRQLRLPYKYTFALTTAIRFIPLFHEEMTGIMEAQISRGIEFDTRNFFKKIGLILPLCVPLLISSVRKIEGSAISAELRGFNLRTPSSGYKRYPFTLKDGAVLLLCGILLAGAAITRPL